MSAGPQFLVEYRRPAGPSWWASTEGVTPAREWASRFSLEDALEHTKRTLQVYPAEKLEPRITVWQARVH